MTQTTTTNPLLYDAVAPFAMGEILTTNDNNHEVLCNNVWQFPCYDVIVLQQFITIPFSIKLNKYFIIKVKQQLIQKALQRQKHIQRTIKKNTQLYYKKCDNSLQSFYWRNVERRFVVLTNITLHHMDKFIQVSHYFGSDFLSELKYYDLLLTDEGLQIFSIKDFAFIAQSLKNCYDLEAFLDYHKNYIKRKYDFSSEYRLLGRFLDSSFFFKRAYYVESQLFKYKLVSNIDKTIKYAVRPLQDNLALLQDMAKYLPVWQYFLSVVHNYYKQSSNSEQGTQIFNQLSQESLYSRYNLIRQFAMFVTSPNRYRGALIHQHSYSVFGNHYILIFYANDKQSILHRDNIANTLDNIAKRAFKQLQHVPIKTITVIGIDFGDGQENISLDMYRHEKNNT